MFNFGSSLVAEFKNNGVLGCFGKNKNALIPTIKTFWNTPKGFNYAQGRIRTCTWKSIQRPERCASANSATWAKLMRPQGVEP